MYIVTLRIKFVALTYIDQITDHFEFYLKDLFLRSSYA